MLEEIHAPFFFRPKNKVNRPPPKLQKQPFENSSSSAVIYIQKYVCSGGNFQRIELICEENFLILIYFFC